VDHGRVGAERGQGVLHVGHERGRTADVGARAGRNGQPGQRLSGEAPAGGLDAITFGGCGCAVEDVFMCVRQRGQQGVHVGREGMLARSACPVQPPDVPLAVPCRELMQHGQHWCDTDTGGDEQERAGAVVEDEVATGRGHVQDRSGLQAAVQVAAGGAVGLLLDADPVGAGVSCRGQRVAAYRGRLPGAGDPQREVLAGPGGRERGAVDGGEVDRRHCRAFRDDFGNTQVLEGGPCRPKSRGRLGARGRCAGGAMTFGIGKQVAE
jgi:hypothetical protein